jgi:hypothetical protein
MAPGMESRTADHLAADEVGGLLFDIGLFKRCLLQASVKPVGSRIQQVLGQLNREGSR